MSMISKSNGPIRVAHPSVPGWVGLQVAPVTLQGQNPIPETSELTHFLRRLRKWVVHPVLALAALFIIAAILPACGGHDDHPDGLTYVCPMHPNIVDDKPSNCPICGMKLVPVEKNQPSAASTPSAAPAAARERKIKFYRNPMDPTVTSPVPMKDNMGMDYIPVYEDETSPPPTIPGRGEVMISAERRQLIGLRTAPAVMGQVSGSWRTVGRVSADPTSVRRTSVRVSGYIEKVFVDFEGMAVKKGDPLFSLYSPEIYAAEQEHLVALRTRRELSGGMLGGDGEELVAASRRKLRLFEVPEAEVRRLERTGKAMQTVTLVSPVNGVVTMKNVVEGSAVKPGDSPYEITDLATVWIYADIYEADLGRVKVGMPATFNAESFRGRGFSGEVAFLDPVLDPETRTLKAHLRFKNPDGLLRPGMYGQVELKTEPRPALLIPADAVIPTGTRNLVFVSLDEGRFTPRELTLGEKSGDSVEALSGLTAGEEVVTRANFLIDSESSLRASLSALGQ